MEMDKPKRIKILTISDNPLAPSGVAIQTRNMIEGLLKTGKYEIHSFGGAITHNDYKPIRTQEYQDLWTIYPVKDFGTQDLVRSFLATQKPDILWFMTDPRFYVWLWQIAIEIREVVPMVYYNVWDNFPAPQFNEALWSSNDLLVAMSDITHQMNKIVSPNTENMFLPLAVDTSVYQKKEPELVQNTRTKIFGPNDTKFTFMWVNRNARRKQPGTLIWWFKDIVEKYGSDNVRLVMHTNPLDQFGQNLYEIVKEAGLMKGEVVFSNTVLQPNDLAILYNIADCVVNISDAEGVGLGTIEALSCETPIIGTLTGGLQEQFEFNGELTGFGLKPVVQSLVGSQDVPYIYEDRVSKEDFVEACCKMIDMNKEDREKMGLNGRAYVLEKYNMTKYIEAWDKILTETHEKHGSWETRKNHKSYSVEEI